MNQMNVCVMKSRTQWIKDIVRRSFICGFSKPKGRAATRPRIDEAASGPSVLAGMRAKGIAVRAAEPDGRLVLRLRLARAGPRSQLLRALLVLQEHRLEQLLLLLEALLRQMAGGGGRVRLYEP